jgi:pimeloyl-ACP methyl ester carboxylesterase
MFQASDASEKVQSMGQVVLVHGLWMNGMEMAWLGRRLAHCGFQPRRFVYADLRQSPAQNAALLHQWQRQLPGEQIHFVAHSLGGIVLLHLFNRYVAQQRPGRVVLLGSPVRGSHAARRLATHCRLGLLLGKSTQDGLLGGAPEWDGARELGVISGSLGFGLGRLLGALQRPHDGTVCEAETLLPTMSDHLSLPVSHLSMLTSTAVADAVCWFLKTGRFRATVCSTAPNEETQTVSERR